MRVVKFLHQQDMLLPLSSKEVENRFKEFLKAKTVAFASFEDNNQSEEEYEKDFSEALKTCGFRTGMVFMDEFGVNVEFYEKIGHWTIYKSVKNCGKGKNRYNGKMIVK